MRYFFALAALVLGIVLLILGAGQRTFLAQQHVFKAATGPVDSRYTVIDGAELAKIKGNIMIKLGKAVGEIAIGNKTDVAAWVAPVAHTQLTVDEKNHTISVQQVPAAQGAAAQQASPPDSILGSDMWRWERAGKGASELEFIGKLASWQAVLIAPAAGVSVYPEITWTIPLHTPWAGPLLTVGGVVTLVGIILYVLFVDRDSRGLGPRRGKTGSLQGLRRFLQRKPKVEPVYEGKTSVGKTRQNAAKIVALSLASTVLLAGCSASYWPDFTPESPKKAVGSEKPVVLSELQLDSIIKNIAETALAADKAKDAGLLESRFAGAALAQRAANYKITAAVANYPVKVPFLRSARLGYELVQQIDTWPRHAFVTVAAAVAENEVHARVTDVSKTPALGLMLVQASPYENFKVTHVLNLRGTLPEATPTAEGAAILDNQITTLALSPQTVAEIYAKLLITDPATVEQAAAFELSEDPVLAVSGKVWVQNEKANTEGGEAKAEYSATAAVAGSPVAFATGAGGALVTFTVNEERIVKADTNSEIAVSDVVKAVSGLDGKKKKIVQKVQHQLLFFVPVSGAAEKITLLGSNSEIVEASE